MQLAMFDSGLSNTISFPSNVRFLDWSVRFWIPRPIVRTLKEIQCSNATASVRFWAAPYHFWTPNVSFWLPGAIVRALKKIQCSNATASVRFWAVQYHFWILDCQISLLKCRLLTSRSYPQSTEKNSVLQRHCQCSLQAPMCLEDAAFTAFVPARFLWL